MQSIEKLFGNIFNDVAITPDRLLLYAKDHLSRLTKGNSNGKFTTDIAILTPLIAMLEGDVSNVDSTINLQSGQTDEVDIVALNFAHTMSTLEGVIANSLGGKGSIGFKEFYPHGLTEYNQVNRKTAHTLTTRVFKGATKYATPLGTIVTEQLQAFQASYVTARSAQSKSITDLSSVRTDRTSTLTDMQVALVQSLHVVGTLFPTNVATCSGFFNFNLLFTVGHRKHVLYQEILAIDGKSTIVNRSFTDNVTIIIRDLGINSDIIVWIGKTNTELPNAQAITVKSGKAVSVIPSSLGDATSTFLMIMNTSAVNTARIQVEIIG